MPVYFFGCLGRIKIGFSRDPFERYRQILATSPGEVELIALIPGWEDVESEMHRRFDSIRAYREWFDDDGSIRECIENLEAGGSTVIRHRDLRVARHPLSPKDGICCAASRLLKRCSRLRVMDSDYCRMHDNSRSGIGILRFFELNSLYTSD